MQMPRIIISELSLWSIKFAIPCDKHVRSLMLVFELVSSLTHL